jgi:hypothetical protein
VLIITVPVCPHAGGVGLCEHVQHLSMWDYVSVAATLENRLVFVFFFPSSRRCRKSARVCGPPARALPDSRGDAQRPLHAAQGQPCSCCVCVSPAHRPPATALRCSRPPWTATSTPMVRHGRSSSRLESSPVPSNAAQPSLCRALSLSHTCKPLS